MFARALLALVIACTAVTPSWGASAANRMLLVMANRVTVPGAPTAVSAVAGDGMATIYFTPPASTGGSPILGYRITDSTGAYSWPVSSSPGMVGVSNGTAYTFKVQAYNAVGYGPASALSNSVTPVSISAVTALLMHFDGPNGGTTFTDATGRSTFYRVVNGANSYGTLTTAGGASKFGTAALNTGSLSSASYGFIGTSVGAYGGATYFPGDFTIEGWFSNRGSLANPWLYFINGGNGPGVYLINGLLTCKNGLATAAIANSSIVVGDSSWHHWAAVRAGGYLKVYLDGVGGTAQISSGPLGGTGSYRVYIGWLPSYGNSLLIDELRVLNGYAAYLGNFTPPTAPFTYP